MKSTSPLPRTVVVFGLVSLLNDFASEMVAPLIPLLLATVLGAGPAALGLIEGAADAVSNLLKLWAGRHSDIGGRRRKPYVVFGYLLSNIARPLIALSGSWLTVLAIRMTDRVGKGLRTSPRDALVADVVTHDNVGRAFGFMRGLDHAGAVVGALAAAAIVYFGTERLEIVIALSAIPGVAAVALLALGVREAPRPRAVVTAPNPLRWALLHARTRAYLAVLGFFSLAKIPESFVLLRGHELGMGTVELLLLWAAMHVVKVAVAERAGRHTDRIGRRPVILFGWCVYAATLFALALTHSPLALWLLSAGLGFYFGLTEGAERALVRDLSGPEEYGTAFGWYHMVAGLAAIPAGVLFGGLWSLFGVTVAFLTSSTLAVIAVLAFHRFVR
jgi:MFS family permease